LATVRDTAQALLDSGASAGPDGVEAGTVTERDVLGDYARFLRGLVDLSGGRPLKVVVDAGNGMGGHTVPAVLGTGAGLPELPLDVVPLYFELDGTFPNHEANPLEPENLRDLQAAVVREGADIGLAFDGDADRCFVVDERGEPVSPSAVTALVASREVAREVAAGRDPADVGIVYNVISSRAVPEIVAETGARTGGAGTVIHNLITSRTVPEVVREHGGTPVRTRVGHSFIKAEMARTGAIFGGEHSAHYYFRDFWNADTGMLAALHVLAALGGQPGTLSALVAQYDRYAGSGEINSTVADQVGRIAAIRAAYEGRDGVTLDDLDGLTVSAADWWFNVRPSNTEPLLRLNAEAKDEATMIRIRDEALAIIRA
jgi:phosphomannomutase